MDTHFYEYYAEMDTHFYQYYAEMDTHFYEYYVITVWGRIEIDIQICILVNFKYTLIQYYEFFHYVILFHVSV